MNWRGWQARSVSARNFIAATARLEAPQLLGPPYCLRAVASAIPSHHDPISSVYRARQPVLSPSCSLNQPALPVLLAIDRGRHCGMNQAHTELTTTTTVAAAAAVAAVTFIIATL